MKRTSLSVACVAALAFAGHADDINVTSSSVSFRLDTTGPAYSVASAAEASSPCQVAWRKGETVKVVSPSGTETTLVSNAGSAGSASFALTGGGLWNFTNSKAGTAVVGVPWHVFGDGGELVTSVGQIGLLDTAKEGPDRRMVLGKTMPVAYSGDGWLKADPSAASTLTFASPSGASASTNLTGNGGVAFKPTTRGTWTLSLAYGATTLTADVTANPMALVVTLR